MAPRKITYADESRQIGGDTLQRHRHDWSVCNTEPASLPAVDPAKKNHLPQNPELQVSYAGQSQSCAHGIPEPASTAAPPAVPVPVDEPPVEAPPVAVLPPVEELPPAE